MEGRHDYNHPSAPHTEDNINGVPRHCKLERSRQFLPTLAYGSQESCKDRWGPLHEAASASGPLGRPGESVHGHSRCAKFESSCDLGFILKKKRDRQRGGVRKLGVF